MDFVNGVTDTLPGVHEWYLLDKNADFSPPESVLTSALPFDVILDSVSIQQDPVPFLAIKKGNISVDQGSIVSMEWETRNMEETAMTVQAYPNPFRDQLHFDIHVSKAGQSNLWLYNASGQMISSYSFELSRGFQSKTVNIDEKSHGLVIYKWVMNDQVITGKVIKTN
jgi:hypothetical protein